MEVDVGACGGALDVEHIVAGAHIDVELIDRVVVDAGEAGVEGRRFKKLLATEIAIIGDNVRCRCLLDRRFLLGRKFTF